MVSLLSDTRMICWNLNYTGANLVPKCILQAVLLLIGGLGNTRYLFTLISMFCIVLNH